MKKKIFSGGYSFEGFEGQPTTRLLPGDVPSKVLIPLFLEPLVKVGDSVCAGQIIARDDNSISSPSLSSLNGKVVSIDKCDYLEKQVTMVTLSGDGSDGSQSLEGATLKWEQLSPQKIEELIYLSGASSLAWQGIPTRFKSSEIMPEEVKDVIVNGLGCEVFNVSLQVLLETSRVSDFAQGLRILKKIMPQAKVHLVLDKKQGSIIEKIKKFALNSDDFEVIPVDAKYPYGFDEILVPAITGKKIPLGESAAKAGVSILTIQAVLQVYEAVAKGKPLIDKIIALCGAGFKENLHLEVRIGTPVENILKSRIKKGQELRIILNSLLTGKVISDPSLPIDSSFSQIIVIPEGKQRDFLAFARPGFKKDSYSNTFLADLLKIKKSVDANVHGEGRPCVYCGFCEEVCPVSLIPHLLYRHVKKDFIEAVLLNYRMFDCLDCNLCTYVCPSKIEVAKYIKEGKGKLRSQGFVS